MALDRRALRYFSLMKNSPKPSSVLLFISSGVNWRSLWFVSADKGLNKSCHEETRTVNLLLTRAWVRRWKLVCLFARTGYVMNREVSFTKHNLREFFALALAGFSLNWKPVEIKDDVLRQLSFHIHDTTSVGSSLDSRFPLVSFTSTWYISVWW